MDFYQRWIVPRLINLAMRNRSLDAYRQRTIGAASGLVLEIGVGSGQNLTGEGDVCGTAIGTKLSARIVDPFSADVVNVHCSHDSTP